MDEENNDISGQPGIPESIDPSLPKSIYEVEGADKCAIEIGSFSKSHGFTGERLGWTTAPKAMTVKGSDAGKANSIWDARQCRHFNGASRIIQHGGVAALSEAGMRESQGLVDFYMENAGIIRDGLNEKGITTFGGDNAPYIWMKTPNQMGSIIIEEGSINKN